MAKLIMTVEQMADRAAWLKQRRNGIGGSDAASIVGLNPWKSAFRLWLEKTGQAEPEDLSDNEYVYWGTVLEEVVAQEFTRRTGKEVRRRGLLQHDTIPYLLASVDRMVVGENAGLECKTANGFAAKRWDGDEIPDAYYVQCQHYMAVTGAEKWYIAALIGGNRFVWKEIPRNEEDIAALLEAEKNFWALVESKTMPEVDGSEDCTRALTDKFRGGRAGTLVLDAEAGPLLKKIDELSEVEKNAKTAMDEVKNKLRLMLGDYDVGAYELDGCYRKVTWKEQAGRVTIDSKRLKAEKPDVYAAYSKQGKPTRVLRIS